MKDIKKDILDAALKLFVTQGFHATPTSKIAREAGVANGTLFHHFSTKDELIVALYLYIKKDLSSSMAAGIEKQKELKSVCRYIFVKSLDWGLKKPVEFRFVQQFMGSPYVQLVDQEVLRQQNSGVVALIEGGKNSGQLKELPTELVYSLFSSHLFGVSQYLIQAKLKAPERKQLILDSFEMLWSMVSK